MNNAALMRKEFFLHAQMKDLSDKLDAGDENLGKVLNRLNLAHPTPDIRNPNHLYHAMLWSMSLADLHHDTMALVSSLWMEAGHEKHGIGWVRLSARLNLLAEKIAYRMIADDLNFLAGVASRRSCTSLH